MSTEPRARRQTSTRSDGEREPPDGRPPVIAFVSALPGEGKTTIASSAAHVLRGSGVQVGVMVPVALNCRGERTRLISPDAELLAHYAEAPENLSTIAPFVQADNRPVYRRGERACDGVDLEEILGHYDTIARRSRVVLIEVHGGLLFPIARDVNQAFLLKQVGAVVIVVGSSAAGAYGQVLMTIATARSQGLEVIGVVLNRYDPDMASLADEMNPEWIERDGHVSLPTMVPTSKELSTAPPRLGQNLIAAVKPMALSWLAKP